MGGLFGGGKKAARIQAQATMDSANMQAANDRLNAQGAEQTRETMIAQNNASRAASDLLSKPTDTVDVSLASPTPSAEVDPNTGRRRTARSSFMASPRAGSGIKIA